jgi:hypothetical protein
MGSSEVSFFRSILIEKYKITVAVLTYGGGEHSKSFLSDQLALIFALAFPKIQRKTLLNDVEIQQ